MILTNSQSGTNISEISEGIYRINTPVPPSEVPGGFSFNQYLILDEEPLLFHAGLKGIFPLVREAVATVLPVEKLRHIAFSHFESDECGALNEWLQVAPHAYPLCSRVAATVSIEDFAIKAPRGLKHGETLSLGKHTVRWFDAPHLPHAWDCGFLMESHTKTLLCGDLFTQGGPGKEALVTSDILGPSEAFRKKMDYYSHTKHVEKLMQPMIEAAPTTLACMHGSAWQGDGANLLKELRDKLSSNDI